MLGPRLPCLRAERQSRQFAYTMNKVSRELLEVLLLVLGISCSRLSSGQSWTPTMAPAESWLGVACSADGSDLVGASTSGVYISTNSGAAWIASSAPNQNWYAVCASADGKELAAAGVGIYVSTNGGDSWEGTEATIGYNCAASADGQKLVTAYMPAIPYGVIFTSTNGGVSWTQANSAGANGPWRSTASSADGTTFIAAGWVGYQSVFGMVSVSTNSGLTWWTADLPNTGWYCAAASADGRRLVAAAQVANDWTSPRIYVSTNSGVNWQPTSAPSSTWQSVASSADGSRLVATDGNSIFASIDYGTTWESTAAPSTNWSSVACSADGFKLIGAVGVQAGWTGLIYTRQTIPTPLLNASSLANNLSLTWTVPSMSFVLEQAPSLISGKWKQIGISPTLSYSNLQYQVTIPKPQQGTMFYRLVSQ